MLIVMGALIWTGDLATLSAHAQRLMSDLGLNFFNEVDHGDLDPTMATGPTGARVARIATGTPRYASGAGAALG